MDTSKHIWEGWTAQDFINELSDLIEIAVGGESYYKSITTKKELKEFCMDNQPYYKKHIPEVVNYFSKKYNIK
jgi:hypothetical protein